MRLVSWMAVAASLAIAAGVGWWLWSRGPAATLAVVERGTAAEVVYATGVVEPQVWAKVATVVRARIADHCHCEGRVVKRGDVLLRLDESVPRAELAQAEAKSEFLHNEINRHLDLVARGTLSRVTLERTQSELGQVEGLVAGLKARLNDYTVTAPLEGVVLRADGEIGELTSPGETLFWVGQPKPIRLVAEVNEEDIPRVAKGQKVLLRSDAFPATQLTATVGEITPKGDPVAKTFRVYLALPDASPLRIGMSVEANIIASERADTLLVPADAVIDGAVFVASGGRITRRPVTVGIRGTRLVEIVSGVTEGERVVVPARADFRDGQRIREAVKR